jgi:hypothetical protein
MPRNDRHTRKPSRRRRQAHRGINVRRAGLSPDALQRMAKHRIGHDAYDELMARRGVRE